MARHGSSGFPSLKARQSLPALLLVAALAVLGGALLTNHFLAKRLLHQDAQASLRALSASLVQRDGMAESSADIRTWRVLDAAGETVATNGAWDSLQATGAMAAGAMLVTLRAPHGEAGQVLEAVIDQTQRIAPLRQAFRAAEMAIALFGLLAAALLVWMGLRHQRSDAAEADARFLRRHDALTGLASHAECRERLDAIIALARRQDFKVGVLVLDLRRFREVNDALGRAGGDTVLNIIAARLQGAVRREDLVARLSADRFAVIQNGLTSAGGARTLAERLLSAVGETVRVELGEVRCAADIGIAIGPHDGTTAEILLTRAEQALSIAREEPEPGIICFVPEQDAVLRARREMERDLKRAIAEEQFVLHWQPQRRIADGRLIGFEALIRWNHPTRGMVPPNDFIPLAEATGLIVPLGAWVLNTACAEAATWPDGFQAAVNLSPAQFRNGALVATVVDALRKSSLPPEKLELEITESLLQQDTESVVGLLCELRALGVQIAMDDFGTGWSSLAHLWRFPFGKLKIDRAFVKNLTRDPKVSAIVATIVGLGRTLDMHVVAEGVETEEQARLLLAKGCEIGQGWLYGKPLPAPSAHALIAAELHDRERSAA